MSSALQGIRILDMTHNQAGPACTQILAWLGAEVIKLEQPGKGDEARTNARDIPDADSLFFLLLNANKKSLALNLKTGDGKVLFSKLIAQCDVLVENFAPGALERLGFGYDRLSELNPRLVYATIKGFGTYGPYSGYKSFEPVAQAMGGAMCASGYVDSPPTFTWAAIGDTGTGMHCAIGILAALEQRHRTGRGDFVEVSMQDAVANLMRVNMREHMRHGHVPARTGNQLHHSVPGNVYPCRPGGPNDFVYVFTRDRMWPAFAKAIGREDLIDDPRYRTEDKRWAARETVDAMISEWTRQRTKHEVMQILGATGIPCGACQDAHDLLNDPHLHEREMILEMEYPGRGKTQTIGCPIKLRDSRVALERPPLLGENTDALLRDLCDVGPEDLQRLRRDGVT
ncbi:MAG TPA: formyl-CoA transferase [Burkholderiales bacterium]|nr:formyl-CoA transferase [Burkholderiales bacterium]